jgi:hypothetical protein
MAHGRTYSGRTTGPALRGIPFRGRSNPTRLPGAIRRAFLRAGRTQDDGERILRGRGSWGGDLPVRLKIGRAKPGNFGLGSVGGPWLIARRIMKRFFVPGLLACALALAACETDDPRPPKKTAWHPPEPVQPIQPAPEQPGPIPEEPKPEEPKVAPNPIPPPTEPPKPAGELPYAKPVPGKPGFVTSPYDPYKGYIDVRGFPPGTEVKDPYSGRVFLVPPF